MPRRWSHTSPSDHLTPCWILPYTLKTQNLLLIRFSIAPRHDIKLSSFSFINLSLHTFSNPSKHLTEDQSLVLLPSTTTFYCLFVESTLPHFPHVLTISVQSITRPSSHTHFAPHLLLSKSVYSGKFCTYCSDTSFPNPYILVSSVITAQTLPFQIRTFW